MLKLTCKLNGKTSNWVLKGLGRIAFYKNFPSKTTKMVYLKKL